jgi:hypothetical protein
MKRAALAAATAAVAAAAGLAGCSHGRAGAPPATRTRTTGPPPLALTADQQTARIIAPVEALGTAAKVYDFTQPGTDPQQRRDRALEDPRVIPACGRAVVHLSTSADPITRRDYFTTLPGHAAYSTHSFRVTVATYPTPQAAQVDAARLAYPPQCPARKTVPFHRGPNRSYDPQHREQWHPQAADSIDGWSHQRVIALATYAPYAGGGTWGEFWVVQDIATKGRELLDTQYFTRTPDKTSTRVEREATAAFELQARRLAGETTERRTASPEPSH